MSNRPQVNRLDSGTSAASDDLPANLPAVLEHISDGVFMVSVPTERSGKFRIAIANHRAQELLSLPSTPLTEELWLDRLPADLLEATQSSLHCCLKQQKSVSYEVTTRTGDRARTLLIELSPLQSDNGRACQILGTCRDTTERRRVLQQARVLQSLTLAIAESQNFQIALGVALRKICEVTGWDYGEAWVSHPGSQQLKSGPAWYRDTRHRTFRQLAADMTLSTEAGLFGQVWSLQSSDWAIPPDTSIPRIQQAIDRGFQSGLALPLLASGEVLGVLLFFRLLPSAPERQLVELISAIAVQLGVVLHHKKYRNIFDNAVAGMFQTTPDGRYLTVNPMLARIYGYDSPEELMATVTDIAHQLYVEPHRRDEFVKLLQTEDNIWGFESRVYRKDGRIVWVCENVRAVRDGSGRVVAYEGTVEDISARKQAELELYQRDRLLQGTADAMRHLLTQQEGTAAIERALAILGETTAVDRVCVYECHRSPQTADSDSASPAFSLQYEWTQTDIDSKLAAPDKTLPLACHLSPPGSLWYGDLVTGGTMQGITAECDDPERQLLQREGIVSFAIVPIFIQDGFWGYLGFEDCRLPRRRSPSEVSILRAVAAGIGGAIHNQRIAEMIRHRASHDLLTGLPNRAQFDERLHAALQQAEANQETVAVGFVDLDRFKLINDTLGHAMGDRLLQDTSQRLKNCLRQGDIVARWGGDEFIVLLSHIRSRQDAAKVARRMLQALEPAFALDGQQLYITTSIGIALYPFDGGDAETLLQHADAALYRAKDAGRNNFQLYTSTLDRRSRQELALTNQLHRALERQEFVLHYQPQLCVETGRIVRMESLIRWQHPDRGLLLPQSFIPFAMQNGAIVPIGRWVLRAACRQQQAWLAAGLPPMSVAVNLSTLELQQPDLVEWVRRTLRETGIDPRCLELEITETTAMQDKEFTRHVLEALSQMGVSIALDDFGTGAASLSYLHEFPLNTLKIGQALIRQLQPNSSEAAIVAAIVALGNGLGLNVVAEGVETPEQRTLVRSLHCRQMQGNLFSPPLATSDATHLLEIHALEMPCFES